MRAAAQHGASASHTAEAQALVKSDQAGGSGSLSETEPPQPAASSAPMTTEAWIARNLPLFISGTCSPAAGSRKGNGNARQ